MVVIRIKENDNSQIFKNINNNDVDVIVKLKLCKLLPDSYDNNVLNEIIDVEQRNKINDLNVDINTKKIEFLKFYGYNSKIKHNNKNDEYTIFELQQQSYRQRNFTRSIYPRNKYEFKKRKFRSCVKR